MKAQVLVTRESLNALLLTNDEAVKRAILHLFDRQTAIEQALEQTDEHNGIGFTGADAEFYSSLAKGIKKYGSLTAKQFAAVRRVNAKGFTALAKYHRQLNEIAMAKQNQRIAA